MSHPGFEEVTVAETRLSDIDGQAGELIINGFPVRELATNASFEESAFLLLYDRLPSAEELAKFRTELAGQREIGAEVKGVLRQAAREEKPAMEALRMGVAAASLGETTDATEQASLRMIGVMPTIAATYWRYHQGQDPLPPRADLGQAANYLYMLTGEEPDPATIRGLETYLNTVIEHGLNASTFTARVVVSTESDIVSAVTAAVGALKGPLHGGAPGPVLEMLREIHETGDPEEYIRAILDDGERVMGFGHRVYRVRDPRAAVLEAAAERVHSAIDDADFFATATEVEQVAVDLLAEYSPDRRLETNVEFYTAVLLAGIGIPRALFSPTFAVSRVVGWTAHAREQLADNRLIRPTARYVGPRDRSWIPIDER